MLIEETLDKLNAMKIGAMADACRQQMQTDEAAALAFEERLGLLVDAEWTAREQRKLQRRLHSAKLRYPATLEAVDFSHPRRLNRQQVTTPGTEGRAFALHDPDRPFPAACRDPFGAAFELLSGGRCSGSARGGCVGDLAQRVVASERPRVVCYSPAAS